MRKSRKKDNATLRLLQVYDGRILVGSISADGDTFGAFDAKGKQLGSFADQATAASAIDAALASLERKRRKRA
jgi:hypothetical protein